MIWLPLNQICKKNYARLVMDCLWLLLWLSFFRSEVSGSNVEQDS